MIDVLIPRATETRSSRRPGVQSERSEPEGAQLVTNYNPALPRKTGSPGPTTSVSEFLKVDTSGCKNCPNATA